MWGHVLIHVHINNSVDYSVKLEGHQAVRSKTEAGRKWGDNHIKNNRVNGGGGDVKVETGDWEQGCKSDGMAIKGTRIRSSSRAR